MAPVEDADKNELNGATAGSLVSHMNKRKEADKIVRRHVLYAMGAGLVPVPLIDIAAVTAVQIDMLRQLANLYGSDYSVSNGKAFASALAGSTLARLGATVVKSMPGIGTLVGGTSMSILSGASTFAVGKVATEVLGSGGDLATANMEAA